MLKIYKILSVVFVGMLLLTSCESSVKADYDTLKTKNIIMVGDDGKNYKLSVKNDSTGKGNLVVEEMK